MSFTLKCPTCKNEITWDESPFRPFCSERCSLIDLGAWANGDYRIPTSEKQPEGNNPEQDIEVYK
jgi:endogenous inhibitor of DNA gyrase (YacG/DUF329 family)